MNAAAIDTEARPADSRTNLHIEFDRALSGVFARCGSTVTAAKDEVIESSMCVPAFTGFDRLIFCER